MRRFLLWYLPITASLAATGIFAAGFYSFLRGDLGTPVNIAPQRRAEPSATAQRTIAPIILGDSVARGIGDETGLGLGGRLTDELKRRQLPNKPAINVAVSGWRTGDLQRQLESANVRALIGEANVVVISIGGNDLWGAGDWRNAPPENPDAIMNGVLDRLESIVRTVRGANPTARIFLLGLYNPFASTPYGAQLSALVNRWNGRLLERFGGDVTVVPVADLFSHRDRLSLDKFHPGGEGYALIVRRIAESL